MHIFGGTNHSAEKFFKRIRKEKGKARAVDDLDNIQTERTPQKCFRCGSEDHMIANVQIYQKIMRNGKSKYILMKKVIMHATTAIITVNKRYMDLWHACLAMTNILVKIMVTIFICPIRFWIMEHGVT